MITTAKIVLIAALLALGSFACRGQATTETVSYTHLTLPTILRV